jgi:alpha-glucosidase
MLRCLLAILGSLAVVTSLAGTIDLTSPDGTVLFQCATDSEGHLQYRVTHGGHARLLPARAGIVVDHADLGARVSLGEPQTRGISEVFPWRGHKTSGTNRCQATAIAIHPRTGVDWTLEVRVFNDGAAFRYRVPGAGARHIQGESTGFQLPQNSTAWFQTDTVNYEGAYHSAQATQIPLERKVDKQMAPVHIGMPMTMVYADGGFGLLSEAALYHYSGLTLRPEGGAKLRAVFEDDAQGWDENGPVLSPWRVIVLSKDLNGIVNSDVIASLCEPPDPQLFPAGFDTPWIRPGKAPCTWMVYGNDGAQWDRQKWFVDVAAATGCEYLLVDGGWQSEKWGWLKDGGDLWGRAAELCRYAAERKVGILLWHAFADGREDGPGLTTVEARETLFQNCQKAGVKGVKIDFFDSESRATIEAYEDLLRRSAKYQIMVNFHGANKPTGEMRTWPHEMTREGIREQEYVLWGELPLAHYGALPFTRMAAGHGDFLPGYVQPKFLRNTTLIFQMASTVVFSTPFLCWPDNPEAYLDSPLLQFVRAVPVTWEETRILRGSVIGDTVIMARRKGAEWYVAVLNCRAQARNLELDLSPFIGNGQELTLYRDGATPAACQIESGTPPPSTGKLNVSLLPGGGFMAHLHAPKNFGGWK